MRSEGDVGTRRASVEKLQPIDTLFQLEDVWSKPELWEAPRRKLLSEAVNTQVARCALYRAFFQRSGGDVNRVEEIGMAAVPVLPVRAFKHQGRDLRTDSLQDGQLFRSSGTQGIMSEVFRNEVTLSRLLGSVELGARELAGISDDATVVLVGPDLENAGGIWFSYVMALVELLFPTVSVLKDGTLNRNLAFDVLASRGEFPKLIVGVPPAIWDLVQSAREAGVVLRDVTHVITGGGWKRRTDEEVSVQLFRDAIHHHPGGADIVVRDSYNMVELNTVLFECEKGWFHVPPWLFIDALDPTTMSSVGKGRPGLLTFYDASASSFPGFVLTEDVVALGREEHCPCGRAGETMRFIRRVRRSDSRGCARRVDQSIR